MKIAAAIIASFLLATLACEPAPSPPSEWSIGQLDASRPPCEVGGEVRELEDADAPIPISPARAFCDLVAVPVTTLRPSSDGSRPDPGSRVVMSGDGRYFSTAARGPEILEWSPQGEFVRAWGRAGEGPGELSDRGGLLLYSGPADSLFVLDGGQRWTVLDPQLGYVRSFQGQFNGRNASSLHVVGDRGILTTSTLSTAPGASFHWMTFEGGQGASFGPTPDSPSSSRVDQVSGRDPRGGFWTAPPNGAPVGMTLTHWSFEGEPMRALERDAEWLPAAGYPEVDLPGEPALPEYEVVHVDNTGWLWVIAAVRDPRWRPIEGPEKREVMEELYDGRMEVIDPASATVVASLRYDGPQDVLPPASRFLRDRRSYRPVTDSLGFTSIEIFDLHLVGR